MDGREIYLFENKEAMTQEPTADLRLQWEREARSKANGLYDEIMEGLKHKACVTGYLAARLVAYQEYQKLLEEKDAETIRFASWLINAGPQRVKDLLQEYHSKIKP